MHVRTQIIPCAAGTYQDQYGQTKCKNCPAGSYCPYGTTSYRTCPLGSFCPLNTGFSTQYICPDGTYGSSTDLTKIGDCTGNISKFGDSFIYELIVDQRILHTRIKLCHLVLSFNRNCSFHNGL